MTTYYVLLIEGLGYYAASQSKNVSWSNQWRFTKDLELANKWKTAKSASDTGAWVFESNIKEVSKRPWKIIPVRVTTDFDLSPSVIEWQTPTPQKRRHI